LIDSGIAWFSVDGTAEQGSINEHSGIIRIVSDIGNPVLSVFKADISGSVTLSSQVRNISATVTERVVFDDNAVYIAVAAGDVFAIDTSLPDNPAFLEEVHALSLFPDNIQHYWDSQRFYTVEVDAVVDENGERTDVRAVTVTMFERMESTVSILHSFRLPLNDAVFREYINSPAEQFREAVAASPEAGVIVIPVTYFNAVSRVESFFILHYDDDYGFTEAGRVTEIGSNTRSHTVIIRGGYIYTIWDSLVRSAAMDSTIIALHELK
jgi:hypothetical protein